MKNLSPFIKEFGLEKNIVCISFSQTAPQGYFHHKDTFCTGLARVFHTQKTVVFHHKLFPQCCLGGAFFFGQKEIPLPEIYKNYVEDEKVFACTAHCQKFLQEVPLLPKEFQDSYIVMEPFAQGKNYDVVLLLLSPAQIGRIVGLANYDHYQEIKIIPNQSTCVSLFAPLLDNALHLNFIDYFDRYHQGNIDGKLLRPEEKMIISMTFKQFETLVKNFPESGQGGYKTKLQAQAISL